LTEIITSLAVYQSKDGQGNYNRRLLYSRCGIAQKPLVDFVMVSEMRHVFISHNDAMKSLNHDMALIQEAKGCDDCLCWLQYCHAECCSQFHFPINPKSDITIVDGIVKIRIPMTPDRKWYFEVHGVKVKDDLLLIPEDYCSFTPELISVRMRCSLLTAGQLCSGHPENKPEICKNVTLDNAKEGKCDLTPHCLFVYKQKA
jgi:hypothetical protein